MPTAYGVRIPNNPIDTRNASISSKQDGRIAKDARLDAARAVIFMSAQPDENDVSLYHEANRVYEKAQQEMDEANDWSSRCWDVRNKHKAFVSSLLKKAEESRTEANKAKTSASSHATYDKKCNRLLETARVVHDREERRWQKSFAALVAAEEKIRAECGSAALAAVVAAVEERNRLLPWLQEPLEAEGSGGKRKRSSIRNADGMPPSKSSKTENVSAEAEGRSKHVCSDAPSVLDGPYAKQVKVLSDLQEETAKAQSFLAVALFKLAEVQCLQQGNRESANKHDQRTAVLEQVAEDDDRAWREARDAAGPRQAANAYINASKCFKEKEAAADAALQHVEEAEKVFRKAAAAGMSRVIKDPAVKTVIADVADKIRDQREQPIERGYQPVVLPYLTGIYAYSPTDTCWNLEKEKMRQEANGKRQGREAAAGSGGDRSGSASATAVRRSTRETRGRMAEVFEA